MKKVKEQSGVVVSRVAERSKTASEELVRLRVAFSPTPGFGLVVRHFSVGSGKRAKNGGEE